MRSGCECSFKICLFGEGGWENKHGATKECWHAAGLDAQIGGRSQVVLKFYSRCTNGASFATFDRCQLAVVLTFAKSWHRSSDEVCKITLFWGKKKKIRAYRGTLWDSLKDKWVAGEWKMQSRCFFPPFLMAARHYWCHYWDLLWLLLIPWPAWGKKPLVVQSSLFTSQRQFEPISSSLP